MKIQVLARVKVAALAIGLAFSSYAAADSYTTLTLPTLNSNLKTWSDGGAYNTLFPSTTTLGGVQFQFQQDANSSNVFAGVGEIDIKTNVFGATSVYTLINTAWGSMGVTVGSITFVGTGNASYTVDLVEGTNVRDHYFGSYVNTTTASYVTQDVFGISGGGHAHLDMQQFVLPGQFRNQTLTDVIFSSTGGGQGSPFLAAATVAAVPEPETYALMIAGLGILGGMVRRRKQTT